MGFGDRGVRGDRRHKRYWGHRGDTGNREAGTPGHMVTGRQLTGLKVLNNVYNRNYNLTWPQTKP